MNSLRLLAPAALCLASVLALDAETVRLSDDTSASTGVAAANGMAPSLSLKSKPGKPKQSLGYLKFDLSDLPATASSATVAKATLRVFVNKSTKPGGAFNVQVINDDWTEDTLTGATPPTLGATVASAVPAGPDVALSYVSVDVTSAVQSWLSSSVPNHGLALVPAGVISASLDAKESAATSHPATLEISFANVASTGVGPAGPKGDPGATGPAGSQGPAGPKGAAGAAGTPGAKGDPGVAGSPGIAGAPGLAGAPGVQGNPGADGAPGAPGNLRIYGSGSRGSQTFNITNPLFDEVTEYVDFTVSPGTTLTVPSGTVIRCTGKFTNNGAITVGTFASCGAVDASGGSFASHPGLCNKSAGNGVITTSAGAVHGGSASGFLNESARNLMVRGPAGGGAGGTAFGGSGGSGGGAFAIVAKGQIVNNGVIRANGDDGSIGGGGGGAGGLIVMISPTSIQNVQVGSVQVTGGDGGASSSSNTAGGGGAGGVIHLIGVQFSGPALAFTIDGGAAGSPNVAVTTATHGSGGGGGSLYRFGGSGALTTSGSAASAGQKGIVYQSSETDPSGYFY